MPISVEAIEKILGIHGKIDLTPSEMAKNLKVTFFPYKTDADTEIIKFRQKLEAAFKDLGVTVVPYEEAIERPSLKNIFKRCFLFFKVYSLVLKSLKAREEINKFRVSHRKKFFRFVFGKKIRKKIAIVSLGEDKEGLLPMDYTTSFKENPIITVIKKDSEINEASPFEQHMNQALGLFAWNMTNLAVCVDDKSWTIYSFNLSNPTLPANNNFDKNVLNSLIPKISAPVVPPAINDFTIIEGDFDCRDPNYTPYINDLVESGPFFEKTGLYPAGRKIDSLKFRNLFYRWIGAIHLDERNGMSYGFMARQLPVELTMPQLLTDIKDKEFKWEMEKQEYLFYKDSSYVKINIKEKNLIIKIPDVWVLSSRSGADKTNLNPKRDIIKLGLKNGQMFLGLAKGSSLSGDYKPSFDTKIILSHAVGNAIFGSLLKYFHPSSLFPKILQERGFAIAHWHGYINPRFIPQGWITYGEDNPSVSCSSPQAAVYAFEGKQKGIINTIINNTDYNGDIHIEPHHGTNMTFSTLMDMSEFLLSNSEVSRLGSEYLNLYKK